MKAVAVVDALEERQELQKTLSKEYAVDAFGRADEFIEYTKLKLPDLALIDYRLPDMSGIALCRELREQERTRRISLVLIVPDARESTIDECLISGINDFIMEPVNKIELLQKLHRLTHIPQRRKVNTLIKISSEETAANGFFCLGRTHNISHAGVLLEVDKELAIGQVMNTQFFLPGDREPLVARARVKRRASEAKTYHPGYGVEFLDISQADLRRIELFVRRK